jgi:hypothetical protein
VVSGGRTRQRAVEARLDEGVEAGRVDEVRHHSWQSHVRTPLAGDDPAAETVAWYHRFVACAARIDASVEPFFAHYERDSAFTGTSYEEYVFPVLAIAVVEDGEVVEVAPRRTAAGEEVGVRDVIEDLAGAATTVEDVAPTPVASE